MSFRKIACGLPVIAVTLIAGRTASAAMDVFVQNFDNVALNSGVADWTITSTDSTSTADDVTYRSLGTSTSYAAIVDRGNNNRALQFTHSDSIGKPLAFSHAFTMSTTSSGNNELVGSFTFTRLLSSSGTGNNGLPVFQFLVNSSGQTTAGSTTTAIQLSVESDGKLNYVNGSTSTFSGLTLAFGVEYTFQIDADFSSATQDTWSLKVTHDSTSPSDVNQSGIYTRVANLQVDTISFNGGASVGTTTNSSPFAQIDNINFSAQPVPEVASMGILLGGIAGLLLRRKR